MIGVNSRDITVDRKHDSALGVVDEDDVADRNIRLAWRDRYLDNERFVPLAVSILRGEFNGIDFTDAHSGNGEIEPGNDLPRCNGERERGPAFTGGVNDITIGACQDVVHINDVPVLDAHRGTITVRTARAARDEHRNGGENQHWSRLNGWLLALMRRGYVRLTAIDGIPGLRRSSKPLERPQYHVAMSEYTAPVKDMSFALRTIADIGSIVDLPAFEHVDADVIDGVLDEAGRFFGEVFAPTNTVGDETGTLMVDGGVQTPDAFKPVWQKLVDSGWTAVTGSPDFGGHGFPKAVGAAVSEMMTTANLAFSLAPMLTGSAISLLEHHGSDELRDLYLAHLIACRWTGTMVLTEPEAGSDVGALRTKAERNPDGTWSISGTKIFITWGDHDLADNIIHLVLARTPGAPAGTKGISMFLIPKYILDEDGTPGEPNAVETVSIEHKLGIHASPTCVLAFNGATGYLIGEENHGMRYMFTMMNQARLEVGLEGLAVAERAYQHAASYAKDRKQGRTHGSTEPSPIIDHPDVRRMLMTMKAYTEAMRCLVYDAFAAEDRQANGVSDTDRTAASERIALLTPITKAWCTDRGVDVASIGVQVHGGMGFIEETGAAQFYRDARITPIYEGTNGIQAIDLVMRKLPMRNGQVVGDYLDEVDSLIAALAAAGLDGIGSPLARATVAVRKATDTLLATDDPQTRLAGATPYLEMLGTLCGGYYLARQALAAAPMADNDPWMAAKVATAEFYANNLLGKVHGLTDAAVGGDDLLFAVGDDLIGASR